MRRWIDGSKGSLEMATARSPRPRLRDLDQIQVGIAHVDRTQLLGGTGALDRSFDDRPVTRIQARDDVIERTVGDEAKVQSAGHWKVSLGFELAPALVNVDLLGVEAKREPTRAEGLQRHPENPRVEVHARVQIRRRQNEMVQMVDQGAPCRLR
jgi:hypothetical protein